jgi:hypothetical protein
VEVLVEEVAVEALAAEVAEVVDDDVVEIAEDVAVEIVAAADAWYMKDFVGEDEASVIVVVVGLKMVAVVVAAMLGGL